MNKLSREPSDLNKIYNTPENRRLKYAALTVITVGIILFLSMTIWIDSISPKAMLIMRGCAGLSAIIFVVLVGILTYRANKQYITNHRNP